MGGTLISRGDKTMVTSKRRRTRTSHQGVKLVRRTLRSGATSWIARWREPDPANPGRDRWAEVSLSSLGITNEDDRRAWAKKKSEKLLRERAHRRVGGRAPERAWTINKALDEYLERARDNLRPTTVEGYARSLELFRAWAEASSITRMAELDEYRLGALKDWLQRRRRKAPVKSGRRGEAKTTSNKMGVTTVNHDLLRVRLFLRDARRLGRLPQIDREQISEALKGRRPPKKMPAFLRPPEVRALLEACCRHDRETFTMTREEKDGEGPIGQTPRHRPVGPIVLFLLLSGCRLKEVLELEWSHCYLDGDAPELVLPASLTKTSSDRSVDLNVSPSLVRLLGALKLRLLGAYVFGGESPASRMWLTSARKRLIREYGAPEWSPQRLRQSCASILCNAPAIYGSASIFMEAKRLGHSVTIAESRYAGVLRDIPKNAETIEAALGVEDLADRIVARAAGVAMPQSEAEVAS